MVTEYTASYSKAHYAGILGMGYAKISSNPVPTIMDALIAQNKISQRVFGMYLNNDVTNKFGGMLTLGGCDSRFYSDQFLITLPIIKKTGLWQVASRSIDLELENGTIINLSKKVHVVFDTGASHMCKFYTIFTQILELKLNYLFELRSTD